MKRPSSAEDILYRLGLLLLPVFFLGGAAAFLFGEKILTWFPPCPFYALTGFYCPGCGMTRAVAALARLELLKSACYHPAVLYFVLLYPCFLLYETVRRRIGGRVFPVLPCIYGGIGLLFLQFIWKNAALLLGWNPFFVF